MRRLPRPQPASSKKHVVLLDFDGVICRNQHANKVVHDRVLNYVKHVTGINDDETANNVNQRLYEMYGHTVIGLQAEGYEVDIDDFNTHIYKDVRNGRHGLSLTTKETIDIVTFMIKCKHLSIDTMLFSNASLQWLTSFIKWDSTLYSIQNRIVHSSKALKPLPNIYTMTDTFLSDQGYDCVHFIDDKLDNLTAAPPHWRCIWFDVNNTQSSLITKNIESAMSLQESINIIESKL